MKSAAVAPSAADYYGDNDHYNDALKKCSLFSMPMKTYIYHSNAEMSVFYCISRAILQATKSRNTEMGMVMSLDSTLHNATRHYVHRDGRLA